MVGRGFRKEWLKEFPWLQYKEEQSLNFVMFLLWIVENMFLPFLESKILLWKVNFHIYFPKWQVTSKVSVEPCLDTLQSNLSLMDTPQSDYT